MRKLPADYLERAYAAVLGKLIGVYLGRPFENWTYQRIVRELGLIEYYVHERLDCPLIVTDDDIAGTFTFIRALEDHGARADLSAEEIGETWLNYIVEQRSILWWGGNGNSTEHTAWLNLKRGIAAPASGSAATNGQPVAEQIGAQIFIDGWAIVAPGDPQLAARLAEQAARVSHDGAAVDAAKLWAAMEAEAFVSRDIDHLLEVGLAQISPESPIARLITDVRRWRRQYPDWRETRSQIEQNYGYDKYPGNCHVVPNHAIMIMAVLYAPEDFARAQTIVCTSGWDTDCNAGNVGCLIGAMLGLAGIDAGPDWRGPVADRMLLSSADGGGAINDAVRVTYRLVDLGRRLSGAPPMAPPKQSAQFHFSLPGSVQGFRGESNGAGALHVSNEPFEAGRALSIRYEGLGAEPAAALTPTFTPPDVVRMRTHELMATPLLYSGQTVRARVIAEASNPGAVEVALRALVYDRHDALSAVDGDAVGLSPGAETVLSWRIPDTGGQPIQSIGIALRSRSEGANGAVRLDHLRWDGAPDLRLRRPDETSEFWRRSWVNGVNFLSKNFPQAFRISQDRDEGLLIHGTRQWTDYRVAATVTVNLAAYAGVGVRVQGLRRYYAALLVRPDVFRIVKVFDGAVTTLAETSFAWDFETPYPFVVEVAGSQLRGSIGAVDLITTDDDLADGGVALVISGGALSCDEIRVTPPLSPPRSYGEGQGVGLSAGPTEPPAPAIGRRPPHP
jgi:ADP-ribosylglycohydrolase